MIGHPNRQIEFTTIYILAWEPSAAQVTNRFSRCLPALNFRYLSRTTQLRILRPSKEHSSGPPQFPNQNLGPIGAGVP